MIRQYYQMMQWRESAFGFQEALKFWTPISVTHEHIGRRRNIVIRSSHLDTPRTEIVKV